MHWYIAPIHVDPTTGARRPGEDGFTHLPLLDPVTGSPLRGASVPMLDTTSGEPLLDSQGNQVLVPGPVILSPEATPTVVPALLPAGSRVPLYVDDSDCLVGTPSGVLPLLAGWMALSLTDARAWFEARKGRPAGEQEVG